MKTCLADHEPTRRQRVLVVDDLAVNRKIRAALLEKEGYEVEEASNGVEALELAHKNPPDLILSDILMPVMDGYALCRAWKSDPQLGHIPFVFYSATYTEDKDMDFAEQLGADGFLLKPLEGPKFLSDIARIINTPTHNPQLEAAGVQENGAFYQRHNSRLIKKLEDKLRELEKANQQVLQQKEDLRQSKRELEQKVSERTAELTAINKELESFAYSVSHDLRAPLRVIDGFSLALFEDYGQDLDEQASDYLDRMRSASQRMAALIDNLLELSKVTRRVLRRERINLSAMAEEIVAELYQNESNRSMRFSVEPELYARGDSILLRIVLENLFQNAFKYTAKEEHAFIEFGRREHEGETIFFVRDNGVGFDMRHAGKLFTAFQRLHSEKEFKGSGIGLATVARIVHRHGGGVWAEGVPGEGASFYFSTPRD